MKLVPLEDRVVVKVVEQEDKDRERYRPSGHGQREAVQRATSSPSGPGKYSDKGELIPMPVKEGDIVVFAKYAGTELKLDGEEYLVLRGLTDIIGILPGE